MDESNTYICTPSSGKLIVMSGKELFWLLVLLLLLFGEIIPLLKIVTDLFNVILLLIFCEVKNSLFVMKNCVSVLILF